VTLATDLAIPVALPTSTADVDLVVAEVGEPPDGIDLDADVPLHEEPPRVPGGVGDFALHRVGDVVAMRVRGGADYYVTDRSILVHVLDERCRALLGVHLMGMVMALWLELRGTACLHGSAVEIAGRAAIFLADKGAGKTTTAAYLAARGHPLLTDDLVALEVRDGVVHARPGYPEVRLWPSQLPHLLDGAGPLPRVRPDVEKVRVPVGAGGLGAMADGPVPVGRIYLPSRGDVAEIALEPVGPAAALVQLVRQSFLPVEVERLGLQPARLAVLAALVAQAPTSRLRIPDGMDRLPELRRALVEDG
jgi:hypothetical protein